VITVIVPAHNERAVIARLLGRLTDRDAATADQGAPAVQILVVCNGCSDDTAEIARGFHGVVVLETPMPSKAAALRLGDAYADGFPRLYVDADVELGRLDVLALAVALETPGVLAAAPGRRMPRDGVSTAVRWYYDVWEALPAVRQGLFGRGVIAVSLEGFQRIRALPELMSDDLAMSSAFAPDERRVVAHATVVVHPPRTWGDLLRRRIRAATGTRQAYDDSGTQPPDLVTDSRTTRSDLIAVVRARPSLLLRLPVFVLAAVIARRRAAHAIAAGDYATWLRDESSRR
jgi:glycosyltransferase involved in cell wall biosynthesis